MHHIISCKNALDFIQILRLSESIWRLSTHPHENRSWISREMWGFRGQSSSNWDLVPSAFRTGTLLDYKNSPHKALSSSTFDQKNAERRCINDSLFFTDRQGIKVPGDCQDLRLPHLQGHPPRVKLDYWPWQHVMETIAIAQHHGVPTRLLDFTCQPFFAAFFACSGAWLRIGRPAIGEALNMEGSVAVWAVHLPLLYETVAMGKGRIVVVSAPRAENSYLHSQDAFFLLDLEADINNYPSINQALDDIHVFLMSQRNSIYFGNPNLHPVVKILLPYCAVPDVLALLWNEQINIARLQPSLDKVVQALKDHYDLFK